MADNSKLNTALDSLKRAGIRVYNSDALPKCENIKTGSLILDKLLDGGVKTRRITQFFSKPGVGKSVMAYHCINNALHQYEDSIAILVDVECRYDPEWGSKFITEDVIDRFIVLREEFIEDVGNSINKIIKQLNGVHISCIVVDSIAAANTARTDQSDQRKVEVGGSSMGVGKFTRAIVQIAEKGNTAVIICNQLRDDIGSYGPSIGHTPGGTALKHAIDADVYFRSLSQNDTKDLASGSSIEQKTDMGEVQQVAVGVCFKVMKGKHWSEIGKTLFFRKATDTNSVGYDIINETVRLALASGVIKKPSEYSTTFLHPSFPLDEKSNLNKIVDRKNLLAYIKENPDVFDIIKTQVENNGVEEQIEAEDFVENY